MSSSSLIAAFGSPVTVTRFGAGSYVNGIAVNGATSTLTVTMSIQPLSAKELQILSQGESTKRIESGYTDTKLYTVETSAGKRADRVSYDGTIFEVQKVETWPGNLGHYKVLLAELN